MGLTNFSSLTSNLKLIDTIELGNQPNKTNSGVHSIAIGSETGITNQGMYGTAIGQQAGQLNQGSNAITIGYQAGQNHQNPFGIAIGKNAGQHSVDLNMEQEQSADPLMMTISNLSGFNIIPEPVIENTPEKNTIAIGSDSGQINQKMNSISIGHLSGKENQNMNSISIGTAAGQTNQGTNAIAIGTAAGQTNQHSNSIILNASETPLNSTGNGFFVNPVRKAINSKMLVYIRNSCEIVARSISLVHVGDLKYSSRMTDDDQWFICDGRNVSINDYPILFSMIRYAFGGFGDMFRIPDARGRVLGAIGHGDELSNRIIGQKVGLEKHKLTINQLPNHTHSTDDMGHEHLLAQPLEPVNYTERLNITSKRRVDRLPPRTRSILFKIGSETIQTLVAVRTPVDKFVQQTLNIITTGKYSSALKELSYDEMFHLSLMINDTYAWEKTEVVRLRERNTITDDAEIFSIPVPSNFTINQMVEQTRAFMGNELFSNYDPFNNNCQDFIIATLTSNEILTPEAETFIKQDAQAVLQRLPVWTENISNFVTDLGAIADNIIEGQELTTSKIKYNSSLGLSGIDYTLNNTSLSDTRVEVDTSGKSLAHNIMQPTLFAGNIFIFMG